MNHISCLSSLIYERRQTLTIYIWYTIREDVNCIFLVILVSDLLLQLYQLLNLLYDNTQSCFCSTFSSKCDLMSCFFVHICAFFFFTCHSVCLSFSGSLPLFFINVLVLSISLSIQYQQHNRCMEVAGYPGTPHTPNVCGYVSQMVQIITVCLHLC